MKNFRSFGGSILAGVSLILILASAGAAAAPEYLCVRVELIWGTNDDKSPDPSHKAIDADLAKKLRKAPYRWKNYFEIKRETVKIPLKETRKNITMSKRCALDIQNLGAGWVEVKLHGDGKHVSTHKETLTADWPLILAGDAKNDTAWMVVIKKMDCSKLKAEKPAAK